MACELTVVAVCEFSRSRVHYCRLAVKEPNVLDEDLPALAWLTTHAADTS